MAISQMILILLCVTVVIVSCWDVEVNTLLGKIVGRRTFFKSYWVDEYLGVPYAMKPTGALRFLKPVPLKSYNETIVAKEMRPACEQFSTGDFPWYYRGLTDEDCLYLNIWVPVPLYECCARNKTVMYWMYGGGYSLGSIRQPLYDGRALAALGDVIVVTVNYRLGAFGFLYSGSNDAPGNMGLYDQLVGLQWVKANIETFGGNPESITIFGESVGSFTASIFTVSKLAQGLYNRVIMESGSTVRPIFDGANEANLRYSQELAKNLSCADDVHSIYNDPKGVVNCMRNVEAMEIAIAYTNLTARDSLILLPQYGDEILPENPRLSIIRHKFKNSEIMIGNNQDEGAHLLSTTYPKIFGFHGKKNTKINKTTGEALLKHYLSGNEIINVTPLVRAVLASGNNNDRDIRHKVFTLMGDINLLCPTVFFAEKFAERGNNVYFYFFVHRPSTTPWARWMGVAHYEEIQFVFGRPVLYPRDYTPEEKSLSEDMIKIWTTFAKTGHPGHFWPTFSKEYPMFQYLNTSSPFSRTFGYGLHTFNCDLLRPAYLSEQSETT